MATGIRRILHAFEKDLDFTGRFWQKEDRFVATRMRRILHAFDVGTLLSGTLLAGLQPRCKKRGLVPVV